MSAVATAAEPWTERQRRVAELRARQPFAREVLDFYGALLPVQQKAFADAQSDSPPVDRLVAYAAEIVVPGVLDVSLAAGPERLRGALMERLESEPPHSIVERWIHGDEQPPVDRFLARASVGPVLEALGPESKAACTGPRDARHCPQCGGAPQLGYFAQAGEDMATGPRFLLCARCGTSWGYARMTCAGCGEDSTSKLPIYGEEGTTSGERGSVVRGLPAPSTNGHHAAVFPHIRIEACESCRHYLLSIDLASDPKAVPIVDEIAAIPLDLYARERGFTKITTNLVGF
ncbi:MAG TPA: formate dehydrogenase accessory protein FdhE [Candidatus Dormibacteraeota bacterium]|nr:formate dehydrogenase accessory protein FdhE [Candidatus Dormibacteraeota bacterium]